MIHRRVGVGLLASLLVVWGLGASGAAAPRCFGKAPTIVGTAKKDRLKGTNRKDVIVAKGGDDRIKARGEDDLICAGAGDGRLEGGGGNDRLNGGKGTNDVLAGGGGNDDLAGGSGRADVGDYSRAPGAVEANLTNQLAIGDGEDELSGIENLTGSDGDDALYGDELANGLFGGLGNDAMLGNAGTDFLQPDEGDDTVNGGEDPDIVDYFFTKPQGPMTVDLVAGIATGQGTDTLISIEGAGGGEFDDTMSGENDANGLFGFGGNDTLLGGPGDADFLQGDLATTSSTVDRAMETPPTIYLFRTQPVRSRSIWLPGVPLVTEPIPSSRSKK
jgi:Ca2+-binding RTX toxin-like protein